MMTNTSCLKNLTNWLYQFQFQLVHVDKHMQNIGQEKITRMNGNLGDSTTSTCTYIHTCTLQSNTVQYTCSIHHIHWNSKSNVKPQGDVLIQ